ncbi:MAG: hypothetical protein SGJ15_13830 [Bacteroidota bacterium]|nr:hypothetical protein [Bacteroidota bacterium]
MKIKFITYVFLLCLALTSCNKNATEEETQEKLIASIGTNQLTEREYTESLIHADTKADSIAFAKKLVEDWILETLLYQEALTKLEPEEIDVEKQVNEYKKQLINYIYETKLIENNLDTVVSNVEIQDYYNDNIDNFVLKDNIVKVNYFKIPIQSKEIPKLKRLIYSSLEKDKQQLEELCIQNAESYFLNDSLWLLLDGIKRDIPAMKGPLEYNVVRGRIIEFGDAEAYYYLKIKDVKIKNSASPLSFEKKNIKTFIVNSRKIKLIQGYKQQLLENAKANKTFKVF